MDIPMDIPVETALVPPGPAAPRAAQRLAQLNEKALTFARAWPGTCILGAVTLGFIVGKIAARY